MMNGKGAFGHIQLAEQYATGFSQSGHYRGVLLRDEITMYGHACAGGNPRSVKQILQRNRDAMQRAAAYATHQLSLSFAGLIQSQLRGDPGIAVQLAVQRVDPRQQGFGNFHRGHLSRAYEQGQLMHLQVMQLVAHRWPPRKLRASALNSAGYSVCR
ncbi:hypothetical protein D3C81_1562340 [compost metagenome]